MRQQCFAAAPLYTITVLRALLMVQRTWTATASIAVATTQKLAPRATALKAQRTMVLQAPIGAMHHHRTPLGVFLKWAVML